MYTSQVCMQMHEAATIYSVVEPETKLTTPVKH